jgi:hypothetical protein
VHASGAHEWGLPPPTCLRAERAQGRAATWRPLLVPIGGTAGPWSVCGAQHTHERQRGNEKGHAVSLSAPLPPCAHRGGNAQERGGGVPRREVPPSILCNRSEGPHGNGRGCTPSHPLHPCKLTCKGEGACRRGGECSPGRRCPLCSVPPASSWGCGAGGGGASCPGCTPHLS